MLSERFILFVDTFEVYNKNMEMQVTIHIQLYFAYTWFERVFVQRLLPLLSLHAQLHKQLHSSNNYILNYVVISFKELKKLCKNSSLLLCYNRLVVQHVCNGDNHTHYQMNKIISGRGRKSCSVNYSLICHLSCGIANVIMTPG